MKIAGRLVTKVVKIIHSKKPIASIQNFTYLSTS